MGSGLEGAVHALHVHEGTLLAGGALTASGLTPLSGIANWDGNAWLPFADGVHQGNGIGTVRALASFGTQLVVGGSFGLAGDVVANQVAFHDGQDWIALEPGFRPQTTAVERVNALHVHDSTLWLGGSFLALADKRPAARVISWQDCAAGNQAACPTTTTTTTTTSTTVPGEVICGDANDDGDVTATDAQRALRTAVGTGACVPERCDADDSGMVTASDALAILRFAVGLPASLDCPLA